MLSLGEDDCCIRKYVIILVGIFPLASPPTKILEGMCPRHPRRGWRQRLEYWLTDWLIDWWHCLGRATRKERSAAFHIPDRSAVNANTDVEASSARMWIAIHRSPEWRQPPWTSQRLPWRQPRHFRKWLQQPIQQVCNEWMVNYYAYVHSGRWLVYE